MSCSMTIEPRYQRPNNSLVGLTPSEFFRCRVNSANGNTNDNIKNLGERLNKVIENIKAGRVACAKCENCVSGDLQVLGLGRRRR